MSNKELNKQIMMLQEELFEVKFELQINEEILYSLRREQIKRMVNTPRGYTDDKTLIKHLKFRCYIEEEPFDKYTMQAVDDYVDSKTKKTEMFKDFLINQQDIDKFKKLKQLFNEHKEKYYSCIKAFNDDDHGITQTISNQEATFHFQTLKLILKEIKTMIRIPRKITTKKTFITYLKFINCFRTPSSNIDNPWSQEEKDMITSYLTKTSVKPKEFIDFLKNKEEEKEFVELFSIYHKKEFKF